MAETVQQREPSFARQLRGVDQAQRRVNEAEAHFNHRIEQLREVCPHLAIAVAESYGQSGRDIRVCQHCGIQEIEWNSNFQTLTSPGGTWFGSRIDMSRDNRAGQAPVLFPMTSHEAFSYRRGPHKDVSQN